MNRGVTDTTVPGGLRDVATLERTDPGEATASVRRGTAIGRYFVLGKLGAGAMGSVYSAYDPDLERSIAIKLLHGSGGGSEARLLREAQALARLSHPNVVGVHEVGTYRGGTFLAMEQVTGSTLTRWLAPGRPWRSTVAVFVQAARGLAAAHDVGLVHGDFKPDNVMIDDEGRVRVMDFGLARAEARGRPSDAEGSTRPEQDNADTHAKIRGTPAYMAPEQFAGDPATAASDQFSLCVALFEALYGSPPFAGDTIASLCHNVTSGVLQIPAERRGTPPAIGAVVRRGLSTDPGDRFASMAALITALEADPLRRRRWLVGTGLIVGLGAAGQLASAIATARHEAECAAAGSDVGRVYDATTAEAVATAIRSTDTPFAAVTWGKTEPILEAWADRWSTTAQQVCNTARNEAWTPELTARANACLQVRLAGFAGTLEALASHAGDGGERAVLSAATVPGPDPCANPRWLQEHDRDASAHPSTAAAADALARRIAHAAAAARGGPRSSDGIVLGQALVDEAAALGATPEHAAALMALAQATARAGDYPAARDHYLQAHVVAGARGGSADIAATAAAEIALVCVHHLDDYDEALRWAGVAQMWLERAEVDAADPRWARVWEARGFAFRDAGRFEDAKLAQRRALRILRDAFGQTHPAVATALGRLGSVAFSAGDLEEAMAKYTQAIAATTRVYGARSLPVASLLTNQALVLTQRGLTREAIALLETAFGIRVEQLGPASRRVAASHTGIARAYAELSEPHAAIQRYEIAIEIYRADGRDSDGLADALSGLATNLGAIGRFEASLKAHREAARMRGRLLGADHPLVVASQMNIAGSLVSAGRMAEASAAAASALAAAQARPEDHELLGHAQLIAGQIASRQRQLDATRTHTADAIANLAQVPGPAARGLRYRAVALHTTVAAMQGEVETARRQLEDALAEADRHGTDGEGVAELRYALAQVLDELGIEPARVQTLAAQAAATMDGLPGAESQAESFRAWAAERAGAR